MKSIDTAELTIKDQIEGCKEAISTEAIAIKASWKIITGAIKSIVMVSKNLVVLCLLSILWVPVAALGKVLP